jgi:formylglycine-generating enzyme required for sulfatase activity/tRNA A-37 threonylcarbamoyl transferase component Bud32
MSKQNEIEKSLGDQNTLGGRGPTRQIEQMSLGDQATFAGGESSGGNSTSSLGYQTTLGGRQPSNDDLYDDGWEVVDLAARYRTEKIIGQGGMGEVLLAVDTRLNRKVAIKRMLGQAARSKTAVSRFLTEAQAIAALNHPNIVQVYDYGRASDGPFLIMEFVEGRSLLERCQDNAIPLAEAIELMCQLCDGLGKAHASGIIHRDIKPANVLLTPDGIAKLTDFGLAKAESSDMGMTMAGTVLGTIDFMPPEQRRDASLVDARSDLWSLAATFYQMVTGKSPKIIRFKDVPKSLQEVLGKALEDNRDDRYQTASEFKEAVRASSSSLAPPTPMAAVELGAGECPKCRARNDSSRKFCNSCGVSLRWPCLGCEQLIPVWDKFCPDCGGNQDELTQARLAPIQKKRDEAEALLSEQKYSDAIRVAKEVASVSDDRLSRHKPWADNFLVSTQEEWDRQRVSAERRCGESRMHREAFDYDAAIHALESIPVALRSSEVLKCLKTLKSEKAESLQLIQQIKKRVRERDLDGLLEHVDRAVYLRGDRSDLRTLQKQLLARLNALREQRDEANATAEHHFSEGRALESLLALKVVDKSMWTRQLGAFKTRLEQIIKEECHLKSLVDKSKADGVIDNFEIERLLVQCAKCLLLNPANEKLKKLRIDLGTRKYNAIDFILRRVKILINDERISEASGALSGFPPEWVAEVKDDDQDLIKGLIDAYYVKSQVEKIDAAANINGDLDAVQHRSLISHCDEYLLHVPDSMSIREIRKKWMDRWSESRYRLVPAGTFIMGSEEAMRKYSYGGCDEVPHLVTIEKPFYIGVHLVTQREYEEIMGANPSYFKGPNNPVEGVSWQEATEYCRQLSLLPCERAARCIYRLPTEAEWEYACRAEPPLNHPAQPDVLATATEECERRAGMPMDQGDPYAGSQLDDYAWYCENSSKKSHPVGQKKPNSWGLFDMVGNVWEWCSDWYGEYPRFEMTDPIGPSSGTYRVLRGGGWGQDTTDCRPTRRGGRDPSSGSNLVGFRVVMSFV